MEKSRKFFIENITWLRGTLNLTQSEMAEKVGVTLGTYQKYEYGTAFPSPEKIDALADAFKINISDLFVGHTEDDKNSKKTELARIIGLLPNVHIDTLVTLGRGLLGSSAVNKNQSGT